MIRFFLATLMSLPALAQTFVIRAGNLIDPATGGLNRNQVILVRDGKIAAIGANVATPAGAETIDLSSSWVMPGLMDAHTHLTYGIASFDLLESVYLKESSGMRLLRGLRNAKDLLERGFTTIRDVGNAANYADTDLRRALEMGWFPGPTILNAGKIIAPFGGQSRNIPLEQGEFWRFEYLDADTPDEIRKAIRKNIYYGATAIKLVADNSPYFYSEADIRAAAQEAHGAGVALSVHVLGGQAARNVILGGADSIEHGFALDVELLRLMKEKGTILVSTDFPLAHLKAVGTAGGILPEPEVTSRQILDRLRRAQAAGVKIAFGSDVVMDFPGKTRADAVFEYLDVWKEAGMPPAEVLKAFTTHAAELLRLKDARGAIAVGLQADIIAMPESPLADSFALRKVHFVMKDGKVVRMK
jgi:imidazolonepropionase-like amidohydrolase